MILYRRAKQSNNNNNKSNYCCEERRVNSTTLLTSRQTQIGGQLYFFTLLLIQWSTSASQQLENYRTCLTKAHLLFDFYCRWLSLCAYLLPFCRIVQFSSPLLAS